MDGVELSTKIEREVDKLLDHIAWANLLLSCGWQKGETNHSKPGNNSQSRMLF
jgi:hypothetical protein